MTGWFIEVSSGKSFSVWRVSSVSEVISIRSIVSFYDLIHKEQDYQEGSAQRPFSSLSFTATQTEKTQENINEPWNML